MRPCVRLRLRSTGANGKCARDGRAGRAQGVAPGSGGTRYQCSLRPRWSCSTKHRLGGAARRLGGARRTNRPDARCFPAASETILGPRVFAVAEAPEWATPPLAAARSRRWSRAGVHLYEHSRSLAPRIMESVAAPAPRHSNARITTRHKSAGDRALVTLASSRAVCSCRAEVKVGAHTDTLTGADTAVDMSRGGCSCSVQRGSVQSASIAICSVLSCFPGQRGGRARAIFEASCNRHSCHSAHLRGALW